MIDIDFVLAGKPGQSATPLVSTTVSDSAAAMLGKGAHVHFEADGPRYVVDLVRVLLVDGGAERATVTVSELRPLPELKEPTS